MKQPIRGCLTHINPGDHGYGLFGPGRSINDDALNYHLELLNWGAEEKEAIILPTFFYKQCIRGSSLILKELSTRYGPLKARPSTFQWCYTADGTHCRNWDQSGTHLGKG